MNRWMRTIGIALAVLVVLGALAVVALPRLIDPNAYRDPITRAVAERTGRTLTLDGDLGLSVFPWLGITIEGASLANAPGFGDEPMLAVQHAEARLRLLPLLAGRLEFGTIVLDGLRLNLARAADGRSNWQDIETRLAEPDTAAPAPAEPADGSAGGFNASSLNITGVKIRDGRLLWDDRQSGARYALTDWDFSAGGVRLGGSVPVETHFNLSVAAAELDAEVDLEASVQAAPSDGRYAIEDLVLQSRLRSAALFGEAVLPVKLTGAGIWQGKQGAAPGSVGPLKLEIGPYRTADQQIDTLVMSVGEGAIDPARSTARLETVEIAGKDLAWAGRRIDSLGLRTAGLVDWGAGRLQLGQVALQAAGIRLAKDAEPVALEAGAPVSVNWSRERVETGALTVKGIGMFKAGAGQGLLNPALAGTLAYDWGSGRIQVNEARLAAEALDLGGGRVLPHPELATEVNGDLRAQRWSLAALRLRAGELLSAQGAVEVRTANGLRYEGRIETPNLAPRPLLAALKIEPPPTAATDTLRSVAINSAFNGTSERIAFDALRLDLDGGRMQGRAAVTWSGRPRLETDLTVDRLNVDRYLPPTAPDKPKPEATPAEKPAGPPQPIPVDVLRRFDLDARLRVGALTLSRIAMQDAEIRAMLKDGRLDVNPLRAGLFGGQMTTSVTIDAAAEVPAVSLQPAFKGVQLAPLMTRFAGEPYLTGTGNVDLKATTRGADTAQWLRNLDGMLSLDLRNGRIERIDILNQLRRGYAQARAFDPGSAPEGGTEFTEVRSQLALEGPIWRTEDLLLTSPLLRLTGKGQIDAERQKLDFAVLATLLGTGLAHGDRWLEDLIDQPIPIRIDGPWVSPSVRPDLKAIAESRARERLEKEKDKLEEKLKAREDELRQKAGEKLQERLEKFLR